VRPSGAAVADGCGFAVRANQTNPSSQLQSTT
jgi:hypothetical protein